MLKFHSKLVIGLIALIILISSYITINLFMGVHGTYYLFGDESQNQTLKFPLISPMIFKGECTGIDGTPTDYTIRKRIITFEGGDYIIYKKYLMWDKAILNGDIPVGDLFKCKLVENLTPQNIYYFSEDGIIRMKNESGEHNGTYRREGKIIYVKWENEKDLPFLVIFKDKIRYVSYSK